VVVVVVVVLDGLFDAHELNSTAEITRTKAKINRFISEKFSAGPEVSRSITPGCCHPLPQRLRCYS
jgi:hypothetical protein